ncbi:MAG: sn-glycerol-3-phosphate ABC transporter ATP-binding protein UgpC, partial [Candidatus Competibacteraceae bacterium]|nr:sn-glycerol-3-phosphate ABC transporter ATP-binding protein UgpC [Candidatus Competibacteraceae bacterium]
MAEIQLKGIIKRFGDIQTIHGVDLQIDDGDFVVFVGPSGCGKSTLLRLIAGLEDISGGDMYIGGKRVNDLPPPKRGIAMVFQSYALYPHMTIYENMAFGLKLAKQGKEEIDQRVRKAARILQMEHLLDRLPKELSGGQRQRVAIGRAIVRNPQVFLFDEPLSNLDAALRVQTRIEIYKLHHDMKATMVYVTHDQVEAMTLADKIVVLNAGNVAQVGAPLELYHHPDNLFVAGFIGSPKMNFIDGTVDQIGDSQVSVKLKSGAKLNTRVKADGVKPGDAVKVGIRPEHMTVNGSGGGSVQGEVMLVEHLGEGSLVYLRTPDLEDDTLVIREAGDTAIKAGEQLT